MRLIDGDKLMMSLADWWFSSFGEDETEESKAIHTVMNKVEESLDTFTVPQWIPVVEDLPKEEGYFFVTDEAAGMAETLIDKYIRCDDGEWVWLYSQHVVAWMPLPEPYKGDRNE